jgi:hypothetical protein
MSDGQHWNNPMSIAPSCMLDNFLAREPANQLAELYAWLYVVGRAALPRRSGGRGHNGEGWPVADTPPLNPTSCVEALTPWPGINRSSP